MIFLCRNARAGKWPAMDPRVTPQAIYLPHRFMCVLPNFIFYTSPSEFIPGRRGHFYFRSFWWNHQNLFFEWSSSPSLWPSSFRLLYFNRSRIQEEIGERNPNHLQKETYPSYRYDYRNGFFRCRGLVVCQCSLCCDGYSRHVIPFLHTFLMTHWVIRSIYWQASQYKGIPSRTLSKGASPEPTLFRGGEW